MLDCTTATAITLLWKGQLVTGGRAGVVAGAETSCCDCLGPCVEPVSGLGAGPSRGARRDRLQAHSADGCAAERAERRDH